MAQFRKLQILTLTVFWLKCGQNFSTQDLLDATFTESPSILSVTAIQYNKIRVEFAQDMLTADLMQLTNYSTTSASDNSILNLSEVNQISPRIVMLTSVYQISSTSYNLTTNNIRNMARRRISAPKNQKQFLGYNSSGGIVLDLHDGTIYSSSKNIFYAKCTSGQTYNSTTDDCTGAGNAGNNYLASQSRYCSTSANDCNGNVSSGVLTFPFLYGSTSGIYTFCDGMNTTPVGGFAGKRKWRVPNFEELLSILKANSVPAIDSTLFPNTVNGPYWTATSFAFGLGGDAIFIDFLDGSTTNGSKPSNLYVRCVSDN